MRFNRKVREMSFDQSACQTEPFKQVDSPNATLSVVGPSLVMRGDLQGVEDLRVSGQVYGNIRCRHLEVEKGGSIVGNIIADILLVLLDPRVRLGGAKTE